MLLIGFLSQGTTYASDTSGLRAPLRDYKRVEALEADFQEVNRRLSAKIERGSGWIRISAYPNMAYGFQLNHGYLAEYDRFYETKLDGKTFIFPLNIWKKMIRWSVSSPDLETCGFFISERLGDTYKISDFVPLGSIAYDPDIDSIEDSNIVQANTPDFRKHGINLIISHMLGAYLPIQDKLLSIAGEDKAKIRFHSHYKGSFYKSSPSGKDIETAKDFEVVYCIGTGEGIVYNKTGFTKVSNLREAEKNANLSDTDE